jgi:hypothetical protein
VKPTKSEIERRLAEQEKVKMPGVPKPGLVVWPQPGETEQQAKARTLELQEYAEHKAAIAAGVHVPTIVLYLYKQPSEETT